MVDSLSLAQPNNLFLFIYVSLAPEEALPTSFCATASAKGGIWGQGGGFGELCGSL